MTSRYRVRLGNIQLDSLNKNILILDVAYSPFEKTVNKYATANLDGYDIQKTYIAQQKVTVTFELRIYNIAERNKVLQQINLWASAGGSLYVNDRDNQYLSVVCDEYAVLNSVRNWTDPLTLVFVTKHVPHWLSSKISTVTVSGKSGKGTLKLDGNIDSSLISVTITANESISSLQVVVGDTKLVLKKLSVASGKQIIIDYINARYLRIRADGKSVLSSLQPESTDVLSAKCGTSTAVSISANNKITAVFSGRGKWL